MTTDKNNGINILQLIKEGYSFTSIAKMMRNQTHQEVNDTTSNIPSKEQLLNAFNNKKSFKLIGESLGADEKTVKKWFKHHGLPTTLKEMKKYNYS